MESELFEVESNQPFSKSKIWQFNRDFYRFRGISAFSEGIVPHQLTSNALVGKTYAELIFGLLKDLAFKGQTNEPVYILELGAGHGRLAFHIIIHLQKLIKATNLQLPSYCFVISDIVEENLAFFLKHPQFTSFYKAGILEVAYFDGIGGEHLDLRYSKKTIAIQALSQPIVAIANYFFDSIPSDLFKIQDKEISKCYVSINSKGNPEHLKPDDLIKNLDLTLKYTNVEEDTYNNPNYNLILDSYRNVLEETYFFFPEQAIRCIENVKNLSKSGLLLLSLDKGFHEIDDLKKRKEPDVVNHGSFSIWVNFNALGQHCEQLGGLNLFPSYSTFHLELVALMYLEDNESFCNTIAAYEHFVNNFGPDDFNTLKHHAYLNAPRLKVKDVIALLRLSSYDSLFFVKLLPRLKQLSKSITFNERRRIAETMHNVWDMYFSIGEDFDLAYEIGSIFYDLGFYNDALSYFQYSVNLYGHKPDTFYNTALSYYQLRQDTQFLETIVKAKASYPDSDLFENLEKLDIS